MDKKDYYDVSMVDGSNLVVTIEPIDGTFAGARDANGRRCNIVGMCSGDLNPDCPEQFSVRNRDNNWTVGCMSGCMKFNTDQFCCRGEFNKPETCISNEHAKYFKERCPTAYSYAFDDPSSINTCVGSDGRKSPDYRITFCA